MTDIVERLRANYSTTDSSGEAHMGLDAADEIERLRGIIETLRAERDDWRKRAFAAMPSAE